MKRKHSENPGRRRRGAGWVAAFLLLLLLGVGVCTYIALDPYIHETMDMSLLRVDGGGEPSTLYAFDPKSRAAREGGLHPVRGCAPLSTASPPYVPYEKMPPDLIHAFISIEDKRFWRHRGIDPIRTARAALNYLGGHPSFGGSTITQQLIKNLTGEDEFTPERKLTEIFRALDLERQTDKETILEVYLNIINLARGCRGVGMAAETYFSKSVSELTLPECAVIAAITNNPARYDPISHPAENRARRDLILRRMEEEGYITSAELEEALATETVLSPAPARESAGVTSWYTDLVISDVIGDLMTQRGCSYAAASLLVYSGGLRIETVMDEGLQRTVEDYYADISHFPVGDKGRPASAFILMDPYTGDILAVAGAVGEKQGSRLQSYATDTRRPAGSCIKPLTVYAPALKEGLIEWSTLFEDKPLGIRGGKPWPANADGIYRGNVTVGEAVAHSVNTVAVELLERVGAEKALGFARERLGMSSLIPPEAGENHDLTVASLALGQQSRGVTLRELTAAYTTFSDGVYRSPRSYYRVLDREGRVLLENPSVGEEGRVLTMEEAAIMTRLLQTVTEQGTASRYLSRLPALGIQSAGKTGTTQHTCDRRFVGYTPRLLAGVWMGYDYPTELKGIEGNPCVGIWDELMAACEVGYEGRPKQGAFDTPEGVVELEFCLLSGQLPGAYCAHPEGGLPTQRGWFIRGQEPQEVCTLHGEPPITVPPADPNDPYRIPLFPDDVTGHPPSPETSQGGDVEEPQGGRLRRWLSHFFGE